MKPISPPSPRSSSAILTPSLPAASVRAAAIATAIAACALALAPLRASAQQTPVAGQLQVGDVVAAREAHRAHQLAPFVAQYAVRRQGMSLGQATLQVQPYKGDRWQVVLTMRGTGLLSIAGIHIDSSTVFDRVGERFRPISQATTRRAGLFSNKQAVGVYDWSAGTATWTGDVKVARRKPVALQTGDLNGLLINLAIVRDAKPGQALSYRFVDEGRVRNYRYAVSATPEALTVNGLDYQTYRVERTDSARSNDETVLWVVPGGDTPIRILQREDGKDVYDLQLLEYRKGTS